MINKKKVSKVSKKLTKKKPAKILLIEDDNYLCKMYQTKLELYGYTVLFATNGLSGMKIIEKHQPDLIVLDIVLPNLSGFEIMEQLNQDKKLAKIPVIILTNLCQKEDVQKGLKLGAKSYLIKAQNMPSEIITEIEKNLCQH